MNNVTDSKLIQGNRIDKSNRICRRTLELLATQHLQKQTEENYDKNP